MNPLAKLKLRIFLRTKTTIICLLLLMLSAVLILFCLARSSSPLVIKPVNLLRKAGDRYVFLSVSNKSGVPQTFVPFAESRLNGKWERSSSPARSRTLVAGDEIYYHTLLPNTG